MRIAITGGTGFVGRHVAERLSPEMVSFLRARPDCGSGYHESKFAAEELVRASGLDFTVLKPGMIFGRGDHLVDHLSRTVQTVPLFPTVGFREKPIRPIPVHEFAGIVRAAVLGELSRRTVAVMGAEELLLSEAVRRVAGAIGRRVLVFPLPVRAHHALAQVFEWTMKVPLVAKAQVRMLAEGVAEPPPPASGLPVELLVQGRFDEEEIRRALPEPGGFRWGDLRISR